MTATLRALVPLALLAATGCDSPPPTWDLERMINQAKYEPYEASDLFADGRAMRVPPPGVVSEDRIVGDPLLTEGQKDGVYATAIPIPVTRAVLQRGRDRFDVYCAACHGLKGDGDSAVGARMTLRRPPAIVGPGTGFPPGRIYTVITVGYGLMRTYAYDVSIHDRWAIVAYMQALNLAEGTRLDDLPAPLRDRARRELP